MKGERTDLPPKTWLEEMIERESLPQTLRTETVESFCARAGISIGTYYYQASKKENQEKILELSLNIAKREVPEVLKVLLDNAKKGKDKSIEMYLDYVLKLAKNLDLKSDGKELPQPILYALFNNNSDKKDSESKEENQSSGRGDECIKDNINSPILNTLSTNGQEANTNECSGGVCPTS